MSENPFSGRLSLGYFLNKEWCFTDFYHSSEPPTHKLSTVAFSSLLMVTFLFPLLAFEAPYKVRFVAGYDPISDQTPLLLSKRAFSCLF